MGSIASADQAKGLIPVTEAAAIMCFEAGMTGPYLPRNLDIMAETIAHLCALYMGPADETVRPLQEEELRGGRFVEGAKRVVFEDGRPALENLVVTRMALRAALHAIQRARTAGSS